MSRANRTSAVILLIGLVGCVAGLLIDARTMLAAYLAAWFAIAAIPIGAIAVLQTSYLVRAGWTIDLHPILSRAGLTIPVFALLFIPVLIGLGALYPWGSDTAHLSVLQATYLTPAFFILRSIGYFVIFTALAVWAALAYGDEAAMKRAGSAGLIVWTLTGSFAGIDWLESVKPEFHSSIYGLLVIDFYLLAGLSFGIVALRLFNRAPRMSNGAYAATLFSVLLLWAYMHAMQYIIIWAGNIPEEVVWYLDRLKSGWGVALWALFILQFIIPFFVLLSERMRGSIRALLWLAGATLALRYLEAVIFVLPPLHVHAALLWLDLPAAFLLTFGAALLAWTASEMALLRLGSRRAAPAR